jgi:GT2 family glycosyltransferase
MEQGRLTRHGRAHAAPGRRRAGPAAAPTRRCRAGAGLADRERDANLVQTADVPFEIVVARAPRCVAANRNAGRDRARHDLVAFVDDDVLTPPCWTSRLLATLAARPDAGAVSARLVSLWGQAQTRPDVAPGEVAAALIPGTCFVYSRRRVTDQRFDEDYLGSQWEDTDWMMRVRARGLATLVNGDVSVLHANELKRNEWWEANRRRFVARWGEPAS